jgi:RecA-family ATPase
VVLTACAEQLRLGNKVVYLDMEDTAVSIIKRLKTIGVTTAEIQENLLYFRPTEESSTAEITSLCAQCAELGVSLVILDSLGEAFGLDSISENNDDEVSPWMRQVPRRLAEAGACVIIVDHSTKANDNPLYPSGSKRKRAVVGGAAYFVEALQALAQGKGGKLRLTTAKDRHGYHRRATTAAEMVFSPSGPDDMTVRTYAPHGVDDAPSAEEKIQAKVMDAAIELEKLARLRRKPFSKSSLTDSLAGMRADAKRAAFEWLLTNGRLIEAGRNLYEVPRS